MENIGRVPNNYVEITSFFEDEVKKNLPNKVDEFLRINPIIVKPFSHEKKVKASLSPSIKNSIKAYGDELCKLAADYKKKVENGSEKEEDEGIDYYEEAFKCYQQAALFDHPKGTYFYGECLTKGIGIKANKKKGFKSYLKSAELGCPYAMYWLSDCYSKGKFIKKDSSEEIKWLKIAAENGHLEAQYELGLKLIKGTSIAPSREEGIKFLKKASEQGHADAILKLAKYNEKGKIIEKNLNAAINLYSKLADQGVFLARKGLNKLINNNFRTYSFEELKFKTQNQIVKKSLIDLPYHFQSCRFSGIRSPKDTNVMIEGKSDKYYFHGNTIYFKYNTIIAAQYPLEEFFEAFWKIAQNCSLIVDLTNHYDATGLTYSPFWGETEEFANLSVFCKKEEKLAENMMLYSYIITSKDQSSELMRLHYTAWPDGDSVSAEELENLVFTVKALQKKEEEKSKIFKPLFIHCLGGIGRTGTLASCIEMFDQIMKNKDDEKITKENVRSKTFEVVLKGRECRGKFFVHKEKQFDTLNQCVNNYLEKIQGN